MPLYQQCQCASSSNYYITCYALLFVVLQGTDNLTDDDIAATGVTLIIAGNDTSGLGIMGMLGLLALKQDVMEKLRQEQQQVRLGFQFNHVHLESMSVFILQLSVLHGACWWYTGPWHTCLHCMDLVPSDESVSLHLQVMAVHGDVIDKHALEAMPYADAVAREALRITPPAPQLFRRTLVDMQVRSASRLLSGLWLADSSIVCWCGAASILCTAFQDQVT